MIVDDEPRGRLVLRHLLQKHTGLEVIGEAGDSVTALQLIAELLPDVAFLDIRMPGLNGLELARLIRGKGHPLQIVFVTAYGEHALEAFDLDAVDYLVKPIRPERLQEVVRRLEARKGLHKPDEQVIAALVNQLRPLWERKLPLEVTKDGKRRTVYLEESKIKFVEAQGHKTRVVLSSDEMYEANLSLGELEKWLSPHLFFRVHRGFIVNLSAVREVITEGRMYFLHLKGCQEAVPLSRERWEAFQVAMKRFQQKN